MTKFFLASIAALSLLSVPAIVHADDQDVAKITCKEFLEDKENMPMMIMWIDGYMSAKSDNTVLSDEWIEKLGTHLGTYCAKNGGNTIMQAIEAMK